MLLASGTGTNQADGCHFAKCYADVPGLVNGYRLGKVFEIVLHRGMYRKNMVCLFASSSCEPAGDYNIRDEIND